MMHWNFSYADTDLFLKVNTSAIIVPVLLLLLGVIVIAVILTCKCSLFCKLKILSCHFENNFFLPFTFTFQGSKRGKAEHWQKCKWILSYLVDFDFRIKNIMLKSIVFCLNVLGHCGTLREMTLMIWCYVSPSVLRTQRTLSSTITRAALLACTAERWPWTISIR